MKWLVFDTCPLLDMYGIGRLPGAADPSSASGKDRILSTRSGAYQLSHNVGISVNDSRVYAEAVAAIGNSTRYLHCRLEYGPLLSCPFSSLVPTDYDVRLRVRVE